MTKMGKKEAATTLRNLLQRAVMVVAIAFLAMAIFASAYLSVSKGERDESKHEETVHATLAELLTPALKISDFMEIQRLLKLVTKNEALYGLVTGSGELLLYDYTNRPVFQQIPIADLMSDCSQLNGKHILSGGSRWRIFCTELVSSNDLPAVKSESAKIISLRTLPRLSLSWSDFFKISLPLSLLLVVSVFYLRFLVGKKILKPIEDLAKLVRARMRKKEEAFTEVLPKLNRSPSEIEELGDSFNDLLSTIQQHYREQSKFEKSMAMNQVALQVAHDIRSPLSSMQAALEYLGKMNIVDPKAPEVLNLLELSAKRLTGISDDLLKKHKGDGENNKIIFSLHHILDELVGEYQGRDEFKGLKFVKTYASQAIELYGDRAKLQRAFGNIIKNAVEAMENRGTVTLSTAKPNGKVEISIADVGPGMPADKLRRILEGGFTEGKKDGHGIGMKVVQEVVTEFRGYMTVQSEVEKGTRFIIELPLLSVAENESAQREKTAMESFHLELASDREPVLVVDDDAGMREQWRLIFKDHGIETIMCESYEDVVQQNIGSALMQTAIVDYHFDNSEKSGADIVQYLQVQGMRDIVLCTAEYWKPSVQKLAQELQVTLCPKPLPKIKLRTTDQGPGTRDQNRSTHNPSTKLRAGAPRSTKKGYKVLVIDDEASVRLCWKVMREKLSIDKLYCYPNMESLLAEKVDFKTIDIAFVDKNIRNSDYKGSDVVNYLKLNGVAKIVLASGESEKELRRDPNLSQVDFILGDKIPKSLQEFFS